MTLLARCCFNWALLFALPGSAFARESQPAETLAAREIVLVRHGHYVPDPAADADLGPGISSLGVAQAELLGARLASFVPRFDAVLASPMLRAQDTATVLQRSVVGVPRERVAELAECAPPSVDPRATEGVSEGEQAACKRALDAVFATRFVPAKGAPRRELLVCHGNVIRYLLMRALGADGKRWLSWSVGHTSLTTIRIDADGSMRVLGAGDRGHLPARLYSGALGDAEPSLTVSGAH